MKDVTSFSLLHGRPWKNYTYSYCIFIFEFRGGGGKKGILRPSSQQRSWVKLLIFRSFSVASLMKVQIQLSFTGFEDWN